jgi:hypothetical protein
MRTPSFYRRQTNLCSLPKFAAGRRWPEGWMRAYHGKPQAAAMVSSTDVRSFSTSMFQKRST